jgi:hypothetical protein
MVDAELKKKSSQKVTTSPATGMIQITIPNLTISTTPPSSPIIGDLWIDVN